MPAATMISGINNELANAFKENLLASNKSRRTRRADNIPKETNPMINATICLNALFHCVWMVVFVRTNEIIWIISPAAIKNSVMLKIMT